MFIAGETLAGRPLAAVRLPPREFAASWTEVAAGSVRGARRFERAGSVLAIASVVDPHLYRASTRCRPGVRRRALLDEGPWGSGVPEWHIGPFGQSGPMCNRAGGILVGLAAGRCGPRGAALASQRGGSRPKVGWIVVR